MKLRTRANVRRGVILPYIAFATVGLCGFVALGIDLGMVMVAKTQAQNAADAAAFAGARSLTGGASSNTTVATTNGQAVAAANVVLGKSIPSSNVTMTHGAYHYDSGTQTFYPQYPPVSPDNYNLSKAVITQSSSTFFASVFKMTSFSITATSVAAHRPRDTCIVLDFSGSMNNESDIWNCEGYQGSYEGTSNNTDPTYPQWGYYNTTFSPLANMLCTSSSDLVGYCNITQAVGGCGPMVNDYYSNNRGATAASAFSAATSWSAKTAAANTSYGGLNASSGFTVSGLASVTVSAVTLSSTQPGGDAAQSGYNQVIANALSGNTSGTTAMSTDDLIPNTGAGTTASPYDGRKLWGTNRFGYTIGPNYWGMTFYAWPPDPSNDWRQQYFLNPTGSYYYNSLATNTSATSTSSSTTPSGYMDNTQLFASDGTFTNTPTNNYQINYKAILTWIRANCMQQSTGDGRPFPSQLRSSNTLFYSEIPTDIPSSAYTWANLNNAITSSTDPSQRFWKEYIDFVCGVWHDPSGNIQLPGSSTCSYGTDFTAGTASSGSGVSISGPDSTIYINGLVGSVAISNGGTGYSSASPPTVTLSAPSSGTTATGTATVNGSGVVTGITISNSGTNYSSAPTVTIAAPGGKGHTTATATASLQTFTFMNPTDCPKRPRHRFWFGPMTMIQYMSDTGIFPGVTTDISMLPAKLGIQGALTDIQNNHPNDQVAMLMFSRPHYSGEATEQGQFTYPVSSFSRNYTTMINSLWYPPNSSSADVTPWDSNGLNTPHAHGDYDSNTATSYGLMLAYNQFSSSSVLSGGSQGGGLGRKGSQRLLILETDGMANQASTVSFVNSVTSGTNPTNNSYYNIGGNNATTSSTDPSLDAENIATTICALTTDTTNGPGFATPTKSVILHCIAFGALFEPDADGSAGGNTAFAMLQSLSTIGGTGFPASVSDTTSSYYYKLCIGTLAQRQTKLQTAFTTIMDDGISIIMVQ